jgi:WD40 repeat protein
LATGGEEEIVKVWDATTGKLRLTSKGRHEDCINALSFTPDGRWIASASADRTIKLWEVDTGEEWRTLTGHVDKVNDITFNRDGRWLASASDDQTVRIWETPTGMLVRALNLDDSEGSVVSVAFSPDSRLLACAAGKIVEVWDVQLGRRIR